MVKAHHAYIHCVLEMLIGQPVKQLVARCLVSLLSVCWERKYALMGMILKIKKLTLFDPLCPVGCLHIIVDT
jgi:hypothetical protein